MSNLVSLKGKTVRGLLAKGLGFWVRSKKNQEAMKGWDLSYGSVIRTPFCRPTSHASLGHSLPWILPDLVPMPSMVQPTAHEFPILSHSAQLF